MRTMLRALCSYLFCLAGVHTQGDRIADYFAVVKAVRAS
jgi:hypothetical protein